MMVLRQLRCYAQTDVAGTGYCYCYIFEIFHHYSVFFPKPTRPSLPLKKVLSNPSVSL